MSLVAMLPVVTDNGAALVAIVDATPTARSSSGSEIFWDVGWRGGGRKALYRGVGPPPPGRGAAAHLVEPRRQLRVGRPRRLRRVGSVKSRRLSLRVTLAGRCWGNLAADAGVSAPCCIFDGVPIWRAAAGARRVGLAWWLARIEAPRARRSAVPGRPKQ